MKSRHVGTRSSNMGDIGSTCALMRVLGYVISDSGRYSKFGYPDIRIPVEITSYELSDQEAHTLHQVKAHDVRAFAASKAFQSGVSLEQILSACHWKSHNTFTQFYLKDVAWADSELYHLGPVVAAQQIHK